MRAALLAELAASTVVVMAAAVADFRPAQAAAGKIKKEDLRRGRRAQARAGAEPGHPAGDQRGPRGAAWWSASPPRATTWSRRRGASCARKGCDLIVANDVSRSDAGFESDRNAVWFVWPGGDVEELPLLPKEEVARRLLDQVEKLREARR